MEQRGAAGAGWRWADPSYLPVVTVLAGLDDLARLRRPATTPPATCLAILESKRSGSWPGPWRSGDPVQDHAAERLCGHRALAGGLLAAAAEVAGNDRPGPRRVGRWGDPAAPGRGHFRSTAPGGSTGCGSRRSTRGSWPRCDATADPAASAARCPRRLRAIADAVDAAAEEDRPATPRRPVRAPRPRTLHAGPFRPRGCLTIPGATVTSTRSGSPGRRLARENRFFGGENGSPLSGPSPCGAIRAQLIYSTVGGAGCRMSIRQHEQSDGTQKGSGFKP